MPVAVCGSPSWEPNAANLRVRRRTPTVIDGLAITPLRTARGALSSSAQAPHSRRWSSYRTSGQALFEYHGNVADQAARASNVPLTAANHCMAPAA